MSSILLTGSTSMRYSAPPWVSLYSDSWAGAPRQLAPEFCASNMKDCGASGGLPDQWNFRSDPWIELTETRARWLFDLQCLSWRGKYADELTPSDLVYAKSQWKQLFDDGRCFTNKAGTDSRHDYINGTLPTADNMEYQLLLLAGNLVDVRSGVQMFPENYFGIQASYPHRLLRTIDIDRLPSPESVLSDPYVCHQCNDQADR